MAEIIPSIIGHHFAEVSTKLERLEDVAAWAQLDVSDGAFAPNPTWQEPLALKTFPGRLKLEAHLMVENPELVLDHWREVADRILIHAEATADLGALLDQVPPVDARGPELGVALLLETPLDRLAPYAGRFRFLQLMAIAQVGFYGQTFQPAVLDKLREAREKFPDVIISIDGGVKREQVPTLITAGADRLVVGSAIWESSDPLAALRDLQDVARR